MRSRTIKAVEKFYLIVLMSIKFWWVLIRNFIVYGVAAGINSIVLFFASPEEDRDLHQTLNSDIKFKLPKSQLLSVITTFLAACWIAVAVTITKSKDNSMLLSVLFWIFAIWTVLILSYLVELGLVFSTENFSTSKEYYIKALIYFLRVPQLTITNALLWAVMSIFITKNSVIAAFIMPGLIASITCKIYKQLLEKEKISQGN